MLLRQTGSPLCSAGPQALSAGKGAGAATGSRWRSSGLARGTVLFDAECRFCVSLAKGLATTLRRAGFAIAPLQDTQQARVVPRGSEPASDETFDSMVVLTPDGRALNSAEALVYLAKRIGWARPVAVVARHPLRT